MPLLGFLFRALVVMLGIFALFRLGRAAQVAELDRIDPFDALAITKEIFAEAGAVASDWLRCVDGQSSESQVQVFGTMARTVARQDVHLACKLIARNSYVSSMLEVIAGRVVIRNPQTFSNDFSTAKHRLFDSRQQQLESQQHSANTRSKHFQQLKSQLAVVNRCAAMWKSSHRFVSLQGVLRHDKSVARDPADKSTTLAMYWGPIFQEKPCSHQRIREFCSKYVSSWPMTATPPNARTFELAATFAKDSKPGRDGIPYSA
jgi:hypothetical protein